MRRRSQPVPPHKSDSARRDSARRDSARRVVSGAAARRLGRRGERVAARWLRRHGYRILARNLRTPRGEVDLLAEERGVLVIVEVKTSARAGGAPAQPPLRRTQRRRLQASGAWLRRRAGLGTVPLRLDVVVVTLDAGRFVVTIRRDAVRP